MIVGSHPDPQGLMSSAWERLLTLPRPTKAQAHNFHFKMYLSVMLFYGLSMHLSVQNLLIFMEFLPRNQLSHRVIRKYIS